MTTVEVLDEVHKEVRGAAAKHKPLNSPHEAFAVMAEEVDEVWDEVRKRTLDKPAMRRELIQVAAMAVRAIVDLKL